MAQRWRIRGVPAVVLVVLALGMPVGSPFAAPVGNAKSTSLSVASSRFPDQLQAMAFQARERYVAGQLAELADGAERAALSTTLDKARSDFSAGALSRRLMGWLMRCWRGWMRCVRRTRASVG